VRVPHPREAIEMKWVEKEQRTRKVKGYIQISSALINPRA
jgi:hypothetical protein